MFASDVTAQCERATTMDYEQLQEYQQSLLNRALTEAIARNEEQTRTWSEYKTRHQRVADSLKMFSQELSVECLVPIGKRALARGKLTHTSEILVYLGEGYSVKYSTSQALALCDRRIKRADETLEGLEKERNLYETRRTISEHSDAFGANGRKDLIEYWEEEKLEDWRVGHREREKEYRRKLAESRATEKRVIKTEEDLFAKLDALELQEELEAELDRLEADRPDRWTEDYSEDGQAYEDESVDSSEETEEERSEEEEEEDESSGLNRPDFDENVEKYGKDRADPKSRSDGSRTRETRAPENSIIEKTSAGGKRVVFGEPEVKYFDREEEAERAAIEADEAEDDGEDDIVRIEFQHSEYEPPEAADRQDKANITSPRDFYDSTVTMPRTILKRTEPSPIRPVTTGSTLLSDDDDDSTDEETKDSPAAVSTYNRVVREIRECAIDNPFVNNTVESTKPPDEEARPVSKFKRDRMKK